MYVYMNPRIHFFIKERRSMYVSLSDVILYTKGDAGRVVLSKEGVVVVRNDNGFV